MEKSKQKAIIAGAGPAGLTAAATFLDETNIQPVVLEQSDEIGGLSRTVRTKGGNRMDIGGHRFFSKSQRVLDFWRRTMPLQGSPSKDDILLDRKKTLAPGGPDPETTDRVMLLRERVSRIYYLRKFFDYPVSLKWQTFANMGLLRTLRVGIGYLVSLLHKRKETSLENFYINRFGRPLYCMFFEDYTEKVWGVHPSKLGADWGSQRVKGLSIITVLKDALMTKLHLKKKKVETSLIEEFVYPKFGPGQLWETVADDVINRGGVVTTNFDVTEVHVSGNHVDWIAGIDNEGNKKRMECDYFLSSMPIKDLVNALTGIMVPDDVKAIATALPYRDFITVGLLVKDLKIHNNTKIHTYNNRVPDTWIYIQERGVKIGRLQIFNNWSPYLVSDYKNTMWIGLEYFCSEGDELWNMSDDDFIKMAASELEKIGIIDRKDVISGTRVRVKKAYPSYFGSYYQLGKVREFLDSIDNLYCIGRNGQHRYNNMDHSMLTAMEAVDSIRDHKSDKKAVWSVNTEEEYHEEKTSQDNN